MKNNYSISPQSQLKITTMSHREIERRSRLLRAQVGDVLVKENIFGELYVSFKSDQTQDIQQIFETQNVSEQEPPIVNMETSPQNYLYVVYNGKSPHGVRSTLRDAGFIACDRVSPRFNIYWGIVQGPNFYKSLQYGQMANSYPGQTWFTQKNKLASTINQYQERTKINSLIPLSFKLQEERQKLIKYMQSKPNSYFIYKPIFSSRGANIQLINHQCEVPDDKDAIVQEYLTNPLLIKGYKFDLRIYVILYSIEPLQIYIYKEGIGRFCTKKYQQPTLENFEDHRMHLTNFEVNRFNTDMQKVLYVGDTDESQIIDLEENFKSKQSLTEVLNMLDQDRTCFQDLQNLNLPKNSYPGDGLLKEKLWQVIKYNIQHVIQASEPYLHYKARECNLIYNYPRKCYALYGFDIIFDQNAHAYCLEVNVLPSMETTTLFDHKLKFPLLQNTFDLVQPLVNIKDDCLVIPQAVEQAENVRPQFSRAVIRRSDEVVWENLTELEQRAIVEVVEAEKRLGDFERIQPDGDIAFLEKFEYKRYLNELVSAWIRQQGI